MTEHILPSGKRLIEGIVQLGLVLGYHIEREFPVGESIYGESPAVDVAWFSHEDNSYPLFIFEVESKATNGMANNPLKVYAQANKAFEKPLFFFHIVAEGGGNSSRPRNLEAQYGQHNYRVYLTGAAATNDLLQDIITQHARVKNDMDYIGLHHVLRSELWLGVGEIDYSQILMHATKLNLSKNAIIASYIHISRHDVAILPDLIRLIKEDSKTDFSNTV